MGAPNPGEAELAAVEVAAEVVEQLRARGRYVATYDTDEERAICQRAGRIARAAVQPRRMAARTFDGTFVAYWTELTPLEEEILEHRKRELVIKVQPSHFRDDTGPVDEDSDS